MNAIANALKAFVSISIQYFHTWINFLYLTKHTNTSNYFWKTINNCLIHVHVLWWMFKSMNSLLSNDFINNQSNCFHLFWKRENEYFNEKLKTNKIKWKSLDNHWWVFNCYWYIMNHVGRHTLRKAYINRFVLLWHELYCCYKY